MAFRHHADADFRACLEGLPAHIRDVATKQFERLKADPLHPSLHLKNIGDSLWSARINDKYRVLAERTGEDFYWFWAGSHADYDKKF